MIVCYENMCRAKGFNDIECPYILAARVIGKIYQKIVKELRHTIDRIQSILKYVVSKRRLTCLLTLSARNQSWIIQTTLNSEKSSSQIQPKYEVDFSSMAIRKVLNSCFYIKRQKITKTIYL